jgi:predicted permease
MSKRVRGIPRQFRFPWRTRSQVERDVDDELEFHIAMRTEELERAGISAEAARREALRAFGNFDATRHELARAGQHTELQARWRTMLEDCWRDLRYGARSLARSPGFTAVAVLVLAVGIGANSAAFSIVDVLTMRPGLVANVDDVVAVYARESERGWSGFSYPEYADLRDLNRTFAELAVFTLRDVGLSDGDLTRRMRADFVSANYFRTLGVPLAQGREFTPTEEAAGGEAPVAIVSHTLWVRRGRDPDMLGSVVQINGEPVAVVGIAPERFTGHNPLGPELWLPIGFFEQFGRVPATGPRLADRENRGLPTLIGRIDAGFSGADVAADLDVVAERIHAQYPPTDGARQSYVATELPRFSIGNAPDSDEERTFMTVLKTVLTGLSGIVLLIACINLANMLLARGASRRTEIAIRQALGGGRLRLVRQLLVEGLLLALAGGAAGLLCAYWAVSGLVASMPTEFGIGALQAIDARPGPFVLVATLVTSLIATLLFGLGPALRISGGVAETLKESAGGHVATTGRKARALLAPRNVLVVMQVALSLALLTAGGLFVRGTVEAGRATPGFALEPIALAELDPGLVGYDEPRSREVFRQALERARSLPGVESASLASLVPLGTTTIDRWVQAAGAETTDEPPSAYYYVIADDYFRTVALPMLAGRSFTAAEALSTGGAPVAIVDDPLAQRLFGGTAQALGRFVEFPSPVSDTRAPSAEIVGVVAGSRHGMTERGPSPHVYVPFGQTPFEERFDTTMHLHVRAADGVETATLLDPLRNELESVDAALPVLSLQTMVEHRDRGLFMWAVRAGGRIFSMLGALALFLAVVGVYGVKAFLVARRTREIGVRMALGATPGDVMRQMLRESLGVTVAGLVFGLVLAAAISQLVGALLYGVSPLDPLVLTVSATLLAASLLLAAYLPTRRATRIDPTTALRHE